MQDYLVFGNAYLEKRTNRFGEVIALEPALAKYTRRGLDLDTYWFVQYGMTTQPYQFTKGSIFHLMEPDINQEIYGLPVIFLLFRQPCSTSPPRCSAVSITLTAAMQASSCI